MTQSEQLTKAKELIVRLLDKAVQAELRDDTSTLLKDLLAPENRWAIRLMVQVVDEREPELPLEERKAK